MNQIPLPAAADVRSLLGALLDREVTFTSAGAVMVDPHGPGGAMVGVYRDERSTVRALVLLDLPFAAAVGAALGLVPPSAVRDCVLEQEIPESLAANTAEVLNVAASLFNADGGPHLRLEEWYAPRQMLPAAIAAWTGTYGRRLDETATVAGYGTGHVSVLLLG